MTVAWFVARSHLRSHWRSAAAVALAAGLAGAAALAAIDGARRTSVAIPRFLEETRAPHVSGFLPPDERGRHDAGALAVLEAVPELEALAPAAVVGMIPVDHPIPLNLESKYLPFAAADERLGRDVLVPRLLAGRRADPARADEVLVTEAISVDLGLAVGERLVLGAYTMEQLLEAMDGGWQGPPPAGIQVEVEVVGVVRVLSDLQQGFGMTGAIHAYDTPFLLTPAFLDRYRDEVVAFEGFVLARLGPGADPSGLLATFDRLAGDEGFVGTETVLASLRRAVDTERVALVGLAVMVAVAGVVMVGQALVRQAALGGLTMATLRALGVSPGSRVVASLAVAAPIAVVASVLAFAGAVVVSRWLPLGVAGRADPETGVRIAPLLHGAGALAIAALVVVLAAVVAWRTIPRGAPRRGATPAVPVAGRVTWLGLPPPAQVGVAMSLDPGRGPRAVPVRPAIVAVAVGVAGVLGSLVVASSLDRVLTTPHRYGQTWDVLIEATANPDLAAQLAESLAQRPEVEQVTPLGDGQVRVAEERVWGVGFDTASATGPAHTPTVLEGRPPRTDAEVAVATATLAELGRAVGDTVPVGPDQVEHTIVGRVVMPRTPDNDDPARGVVIAGDLARVGGYCEELTDGPCRYLLVDLIPGQDVEAVAATLVDDGYSVYPNLRPVEVDTLDQVRALPFVLAAVLALLGVIVLAHALAVGVRRRRSDLAVLESIGFVAGQVRAVVLIQATTMVLLATTVGIVLGVGVGRWGWRGLVGDLGIADDPRVPLLAVAATVLVAVLVANLLAVHAGRAATGARPAASLRSE